MLLEQAIQEYTKTNKSARQIAKEFGLSKDKVTNNLKKRGLLRPRKDNSYNINFFTKITTEEQAYWLGFIFADGCVQGGGRNVLEIGLSIQDYDHLVKFKNSLDFKGEVKTKTNKKHKSCRVSLYGETIIKDLIDKGATPRKSRTLKFPTKIPKELYRHFIRGYFDGDGSLYVYEKLNKLSVSILGTEDFLSTLQEIFMQELGLTKVKIYKHKNITEYKKSRKDAQKILDYLYQDCTIYLDRKFNKYAHLTQSLEKC